MNFKSHKKNRQNKTIAKVKLEILINSFKACGKNKPSKTYKYRQQLAISEKGRKKILKLRVFIVIFSHRI